MALVIISFHVFPISSTNWWGFWKQSRVCVPQGCPHFLHTASQPQLCRSCPQHSYTVSQPCFPFSKAECICSVHNYKFQFFKTKTLGQNPFYLEIPLILMFQKCEFCEKWDFENVNFVENDILKMWILWKMRHWKSELCEKWDLEIVNFVKNEVLKMWIFG